MTTNDPIERNEYQWLWYQDKPLKLAELHSLEKRRKSPKQKMFHPVIRRGDKIFQRETLFVAMEINQDIYL